MDQPHYRYNPRSVTYSIVSSNFHQRKLMSLRPYILLLSLLKIILVRADYPIGTRECYSTLTKPGGILICPEANRRYCVKEVASLQQDLCGKTQYFGDVFENNLCVFRKCAATCTEGTTTFTYNGVQYTRDTYCCNNQDLCNAGSVSRMTYFGIFILLIVCLTCFLIT